MTTLDFQSAFDLSGRTAIITGAAGGIGRCLVAAFRERGARLALVDRDPAVHALAAEIGGGAQGWVADLHSEEEVTRTVDDIARSFGRIDILVNNAAIGHVGLAEDTPVAEFDEVIAINLRGQFLFSRAAGRHMLARGYGRIVFLASQAAVVGLYEHTAYCSAKTGLLGMARCMAIEWGPKGITVNCVSPTVVESPMALVGWAGEKGERAKAEIPTRRFAKPEEVALSVLFLASGAAAMINGANLPIDGGYTIR
ncbi:GolD/DthD family dehydrogenase [Rhizosaccharibacter radicis]|uniref:D-threitol dehydrogenase n=1 Tax=Rhizosaccharibacter radicis TaxID=2782605 RepID=A0ABT1VYA4_9PROT|nr:D-threitol dehydrogenase [Acetobacteraceae bacterium KSS12]